MALIAHDDRDFVYGPLKDHFLRIGDTQFYVPPTSVSIHHVMKHESVSVLRGRNSLPKNSGYFDRIITLTLFFPDQESINYELRPLLAQTKKCPFLPVENIYLNETHEIEAITIENVTVQTTPGFPNTLQAIIQCYAFEPSTYIMDSQDRTFDEMFNWPLFRWYYNRNLTSNSVRDPIVEELFEGTGATRDLIHFKALDHELTNDFLFEIASEDDLSAIQEWHHEKKTLIKEWMSAKTHNTFADWLKGSGRKVLEKKFNKEYLELYEDAMFEYDIDYIPWDIPPLELVDFSISLENSITSQQLQMHQSPTHQYLGSQDTIMVARFTTNDDEAVHSLQNLIKRSSYLVREYHKVVSNGYLRINHQLAQLYGVSNVIIDDMVINTKENFPGVYDITLTMIGYNRVERKMHETRALTLDVNWDIDTIDVVPPFIKLMKKRARDQAKKPAITDTALKQALYDAQTIESFKVVEMYPDLELPTYAEVREAGFEVRDMNGGMYVDPDFFINYEKERDFSKLLKRFIRTGTFGFEMYDLSGGVVEGTDTGVATSKEYQEMSESIKEASKEGVPSFRVDDNVVVDNTGENPKREDALKIIEESSSRYEIDKRMIIAFITSFNTSLKHFYEFGDRSWVNGPGHVITYDQNLEQVQKAHYFGIMRVSEDLDNNEKVETSFNYNVDIGVQYFSYYTHFLRNIVASGSAGYSVENIYRVFNLNEGTHEGREKAILIGATMMYLGFDKELHDFLEEHKEPKGQMKRLLTEIVKNYDKVNTSSNDRLNVSVNDISINDYKGEGTLDAVIEEGESGEGIDPDLIDMAEEGMYHDLMKYDRRGRLVRAFPTFFLTFVDEGQFVGSIKMSDQYFNYQAVTDIIYNNSRKQASSTLTCELSNVFGSLNDSEKNQDVTYSSFTDLLKSTFMPGLVARKAEENRHRHPDFYKSIYLRTGVRVHMRMGYGSNPVEMPTIMNGTITGLYNNGPTITMVAQDDGIELTNKLNALLDIGPNESTKTLFFNRKDPSEIIDELLTDSGGFFANISQLMTNKAYMRHSLGIMHFGEKGTPQGVSDFSSMFFYKGLIKERKLSEINMNIHQTTGLMNSEYDNLFRKVGRALSFGEGSENSININLYDKTVWDVLNIAAAMGPDMITSVHPFGLRNTIFLGKPYFPIQYDYEVDLEGEAVTGARTKSFKQFRLYESYSSIIFNGIEATEDNMYTVAVGTYMNEGKMQTTKPMYVDTSIWPEKQKAVNIDTTLNATGIKLRGVGKIPIVGSLMNKPAKYHFDEGVAMRIAASGLRDYVKDMYDGYLTVMGDPSTKPYDGMLIQDAYTGMSGPADVKEVVHIMNHESGFITMIKPDAVAMNTDTEYGRMVINAASILGSAGMALTIRNILRMKGYSGVSPTFNYLWSYGKRRMGKLKDQYSGSKKFIKDMNTRVKNGGEKILKNGKVERLAKTLKIDPDALKEHFKRMNTTLRTNRGRMQAKGVFGKFKDSVTKLIKGLKKGPISVFSVGKNLVKAGKYGKAILGPIGILSFIVESTIVGVLTASAVEFFERNAMTRQAVMVIPLRRDGVEYTAGLNGNKGAVLAVGQRDIFERMNPVERGFLKLIGVQVESLSESMSEIIEDMYASKFASEENQVSIQSARVKMTSSKTGQKKKARKYAFKDDGTIEELYKADVKAAKEELEGRLKYLESNIYREIGPKYEDVKKKQGEKKAGLFQTILSLFLSKGEASEGGLSGCGDGVTPGGKAKNLSKYFGILGPMIEAEAKKQGIPEYAEILKAQVMQESSGNYIRTPDVFQASESLGLPRNSIPLSRSLEQGVKYFKTNLKMANNDLRLALQAYNFGSGFISYVNKRGGKWTQDLVNSFSKMQANRMGWRRYGDVNYIKNIMRYYSGDIEGACVSGADDAPSTKNPANHRVSRAQGPRILIDPRKQAGRAFNLTLVDGGPGLMRRGSYELLNEVAKRYKAATGDGINVTSTIRYGDPRWHGTGYAVDVDTPNTMVWLNHGRLGFRNGTHKNKARQLADIALAVGFDEVIFGDWDIVQEMKRKYPSRSVIYDPKVHHNHIHFSRPIKKS